MTYLGQHGYPVPRVFDAHESDIVMSRIDGPTMLDALRAREIREGSAGEMLAGLHNQLHRLPAERSRDSTTRVLHLDLHPGNVILGPNGPVVVDWRNAMEGSPHLDVGITAVILAQAAVGDSRRTASIRELLIAFLADVETDPITMIDDALSIRGADPNLTSGEVDLLSMAGDFVRDLAARSTTIE
jgi:tRNA A-37 threonylcarbamoyl transferase component Bud32